MRTYALQEGTIVSRFSQGLPMQVTMENPALEVMTDLQKVKVITTRPEVSIDEALQKMIQAEVRLLIVMDAQGSVVGLIDVHDIMGEKPLNQISQTRIPRSEIRVRDVMMRIGEIQALKFDEVEQADVGNVVATLRESGRQHVLVVDEDEQGQTSIRGIFSLTQIARQLGIDLPATGRVQSFAELETALRRT